MPESALARDRPTTSAIYARAGVPCYGIVNLSDRRVEVYREPHGRKSGDRSVTRVIGTDVLTVDDFPHVTFEAAELLPRAGKNRNPRPSGREREPAL